MGDRLRLWSGMMLMAAAMPVAASAQKTPAAPEAAAPACSAKPAPLPDDLIGWTAPATDRAMTKYYPDAHLLRGLATRVSLYPVEKVAFLVKPAKPVAPGTHGGLMAIRVERAGRLKVALDGRAWVDLVVGPKRWAPVASAAHGHGPDCSGIAKIVEFDVVPGRYVLQIVNAPEAKIRAMAVTPRPRKALAAR
ncbi:hypothetical protein FHS96_002840 [Sphingomonas zeicaulis]|uniref:homogentisate 1,2-dioxygenase n=1 Tax=Sphingomonas zeicaulis TaxID=1632740 RepID=UPI003D1F71B8